jgi:uncharacterized repeat protein (TIGR03843 family)
VGAADRNSLTLEQTQAILATGDLAIEGRLPWSSNVTFLARVQADEHTLLAVYKPRRGERPLWDFPTGTLCQREVAAYEVSLALGWRLVPPTVLRAGRYGVGMVQAFVPHDPELHYLALESPDPATVQRLAAFDVVVNNADRKSGHVLVAEDGALWAIDHGVAFHVEPKLRTVIWDLAGAPLPPRLVQELRRLAADLRAPDGDLVRALTPLLAPDEIAATAARALGLARAGRFPHMDNERRSYPWPPV